MPFFLHVSLQQATLQKAIDPTGFLDKLSKLFRLI